MIDLSERARRMSASATLSMASKAKAMRADGIEVISFATGEPDFDTPAPIIEAAKRALDEGLTRYTPSAGIPELKVSVAKKLKADNGLSYDAGEIAITCGAKHAIFNALQVILEPGDEVLIPAPYWVSYPEQVRLADGMPVIIQTHADTRFKITPDDIEKHATKKTRAIILNYPSNPTGSTYDERELEDLGKALLKRNIAIISDEIYEKLVYDDSSHTSIAKACPETRGQTIIVNGVSKAYAMTGWRMGFAAGPRHVIEKIAALTGQQISGIPAFVQRACVEALEGSKDEILRMRDEFAVRREIMLERLQKIPGIRCHKPDGAFYLFPDVSAYSNSATALAEHLLSTAHIATVSGDAFGAPGHIRFSYATSRENIERGMDRLQQALQKLSLGID